MKKRPKMSEELKVINYIYLILTREHLLLGENIYKIGKTTQEWDKRLKQYAKDSVLLLQTICNNCDNIEKIIKCEFKKKYKQRIDKGLEYFEGSYEEMILDIIRIKEKNDRLTLREIEEKKKEEIENKKKLKMEEIERRKKEKEEKKKLEIKNEMKKIEEKKILEEKIKKLEKEKYKKIKEDEKRLEHEIKRILDKEKIKKENKKNSKIEKFINESIEKGEDKDFIKVIDIWESFKEWWIVNKEGIKMNLKRREFLEELKKNLEVEIIDHYQPYENNIKKNYTNVIFGLKLINNTYENILLDDEEILEYKIKTILNKKNSKIEKFINESGQNDTQENITENTADVDIKKWLIEHGYKIHSDWKKWRIGNDDRYENYGKYYVIFHELYNEYKLDNPISKNKFGRDLSKISGLTRKKINNQTIIIRIGIYKDDNSSEEEDNNK